MTNIDPTPSYIPDPAEAVFRQAVRHIHKPWIHDFLYPSDTTRPEHLRQMLLQPRRKLGSTFITTTVPSDAPSLQEHVRRLLLPSISIGSLSVGYEILEYVATTVSPCKSPYLARQVREDQHGILFVFAELTTGLTELVLYVQHSPGVQERIVMILATAPFRAVMHTLAKSDIYDEGMMRKAIVYSMCSRLIRPCAICSSRSAPCSCPLNLSPKEQPVDFDTDLLILADFKGSFLGECQHRIYADGVNLYNGVSCVSVTTTCSSDEGAMRKLDSWAMWDTLHGQENLVRLVMPGTADGSPWRGNVGQASSEIGDNVAAISQNGFVCVPSPSSRRFGVVMDEDTERSQSRYNPARPGEEFLDIRNIYGTEVPHAHAVHSHSVDPLVLCRTPEQSRSFMFRASAVSSRGHLSTAEGEGSMQSVGITEQMQLSRITSRDTPLTAHLTPPAYQQPSTPSNKESITRPKRMGRPPAPKRTSMTRLVPIAPAMKATAPTDVKKTPKYSSDVATRTIELRKERNRQSARRSHEKKLRDIEAMKDYLKETKKKEDARRQREQELREANQALKSELEG